MEKDNKVVAPKATPAKPTEKVRKSDAGKGDAPRPISVSQKEYSLRYELIHCKNKNRRKELFKLIEKLTQERIINE